MARRSVRPVISEMLDAMEGIETYTSGKSLAEFQQDWLLRHAVERALEIVSEASRHLPEELLRAGPDVPWKQIHGIGNILRHEYHKIADELIWAVVTVNIPPLKSAIKAIEASLDDDDHLQ